MALISVIGKVHLIGAIAFSVEAIDTAVQAFNSGFASFDSVAAPVFCALMAVYCFGQWREALEDDGSYEKAQCKSARNGAHDYP